MKKFTVLLLSLALVLSLAACGEEPAATTAAPTAAATTAAATTAAATTAAATTAAATTAAPKVDFPAGKTVTLIIPWAAGGANDLAGRAMVPYLEKELGTSISVVNKPGSDGWLGYLEVINMNPDGYTICACNAFMNLLSHNPSSAHDEKIKDFQLLGCQVYDANALVCRADEDRWTDFNSLIEYAKTHEVTASINAFGSEDWMVLAKLNEEQGTQFVPIIDADGSAVSLTNVLGGHVDLMSNNTSTFYTAVEDGSLKCLVTFTDGRSSFFPDTPTYKECTGSDFVIGSVRGFMMPKGGDPAVIQILQDAIAKVFTNETQIADLAKMGLEGHYLNAADFEALFLGFEDTGRSLKDQLGWGDF